MNNLKLYTISDEYLEVSFLNYGGRITSIYSKYCDNNLVLSYYDIEEYRNDDLYIGAIVGRYANRIGNAEFEMAGNKYLLNKNDGDNCLHGGINGYDKRYFDVESSQSTAVLTLSDSEGSFPGDVEISIKYSIIGSSFVIQYSALPSSPTVVNLTNHTYFSPNGSLNDCIALFNSNSFTPINDKMIPTGEISAVYNTPFDFTVPKLIGHDIDSERILPANALGYDHNFIINGSGMRQCASVFMPINNITLSVTTSSPSFQFYTGNYLHEPFQKREGFCIETQLYPDSPNKMQFPACVFTPEKPFRSKTIYTFTPGNILSN